MRGPNGWHVRDLKSRNGTYVNDERIEGGKQLSVGDELRVGPLRFHVEVRSSATPATKPAARSANTTDIPRGKQSPVNDVSEVAQRTVEKSDGSTTEEDISRWLLGVPESQQPGDSMKETRTIRMEETTTISRPPAAPVESRASESSVDVTDESESDDENEPTPEQSGRLSWLKGKTQSKKKPGKLPPRPSTQSSKDSCEAAADILREMTRRR